LAILPLPGPGLTAHNAAYVAPRAAIGKTFLELNGWRFTATEEDTAAAFLDLAAGTLSERALSGWLASNSRKANRKN